MTVCQLVRDTLLSALQMYEAHRFWHQLYRKRQLHSLAAGLHTLAIRSRGRGHCLHKFSFPFLALFNVSQSLMPLLPGNNRIARDRTENTRIIAQTPPFLSSLEFLDYGVTVYTKCSLVPRLPARKEGEPGTRNHVRDVKQRTVVRSYGRTRLH